MTRYEMILWALAHWTLLEGGFLWAAPQRASRFSRKILGPLASSLEKMPAEDLRQIGMIESAFGAILTAYLLWQVGYPFS